MTPGLEWDFFSKAPCPSHLHASPLGAERSGDSSERSTVLGEFQEENHLESTVVFNFIPSLSISLHCLGTSPKHRPCPTSASGKSPVASEVHEAAVERQTLCIRPGMDLYKARTLCQLLIQALPLNRLT